jgi:arsenite transporter
MNQVQLDDIQTISAEPTPILGNFEKYLSIWVAVSIVVGVLIGHYIPAVPETLSKATIAQISLPISVFVWGMILPMMLQIDFVAIAGAWRNWKGIVLTSSINYLIQPFVMYGIAVFFFKYAFSQLLSEKAQDQYIAGAVILGGSPCTAMVFVWSLLMQGDAIYTVSQVVVNDLLILIFYIPTIQLLLQISGIPIPWLTLILALLIFLAIPIAFGGLIRWYVVRQYGLDYFNINVIRRVKPFTMAFLLFTLILIFTFQSSRIIQNPIHILLITVPLTIQTVFIWMIAFYIAYAMKLPFNVAGPASLIAASNFFELAVAVTIAVFGEDSGAVLACTVGILTEVPTMLALVALCNRYQKLFKT